MKVARLSIGEISDLLGITAKAIRHYHDIGALAEPPRADNGYRLYRGAEVQRILTILRLQGYGLTLRQIVFILDSADPDQELRAFLYRRDEELSAQIFQLQQQQARVQSALQTDEHAPPPVAAHEILHATLKPLSHGLADVLTQVEAHTLAQLDRLPHDEAYGDFWEQAGISLAKTLQPHEHTVILWLERYLALADMPTEDRQAQAWLADLVSGSAPHVLLGILSLPPTDTLPIAEQRHIQRVIPLLLYEDASPLQRAFIAALAPQLALE